MCKMKRLMICCVVLLMAVMPASAQWHGSGGSTVRPDATYMYAVRDTARLFLDVYNPAPGSETEIDGKQKPTILFAFGGGFISGSRRNGGYMPWFKMLTDAGCHVVSIDYRLGMKGKELKPSNVGRIMKSIRMATEDMLEATGWLLQNEDSLGIDAGNIVLAGTSAGAVMSLQSMYELYNRRKPADVLPADFRYAGVISFAGGILSNDGKIRFKEAPCPILLFHGTADKVVTYKQIKFLWMGFFGADKIAERFDKFGYDHIIYRQSDHGHEVSWHMMDFRNETLDFIDNVVCRGRTGSIDETVANTWLK